MSDETSALVELADGISALLYGVAGWLSIGFGLAAAIAVVARLAQGDVAAGGALLSALWLGVAFVLVALGAFVNPRFRRRLNRRHAPSRFGRVRSVDRRVVRPSERCTERCVNCRSRIDRGLVRRYREEFAVAGVPVYTTSEGYNHYCLDCATAEVPAPDDREGDADAERRASSTDDPDLLVDRTDDR